MKVFASPGFYFWGGCFNIAFSMLTDREIAGWIVVVCMAIMWWGDRKGFLSSQK